MEEKLSLEESILQEMQDAFGIAHEVYAQCFAPDNHALTSISVTEQEVDFLRRHFSQDAVLELLESFTDEDPEDVVMVPGRNRRDCRGDNAVSSLFQAPNP